MLELITRWEDHFKHEFCDAAAVLILHSLSPAPALCGGLTLSCLIILILAHPQQHAIADMLTLAILIWPGLPVALGVAFWAVDLIGRITRCKEEGNCHPQTP